MYIYIYIYINIVNIVKYCYLVKQVLNLINLVRILRDPEMVSLLPTTPFSTPEITNKLGLLILTKNLILVNLLIHLTLISFYQIQIFYVASVLIH